MAIPVFVDIFAFLIMPRAFAKVSSVFNAVQIFFRHGSPSGVGVSAGKTLAEKVELHLFGLLGNSLTGAKVEKIGVHVSSNSSHSECPILSYSISDAFSEVLMKSPGKQKLVSGANIPPVLWESRTLSG
jgi:hypothetical protein